MSIRLTQPLKYHGGKRYLAPHIIARFPRHLHYVEPYAGGLAVLLARDPEVERLWLRQSGPTAGRSELVNDLDGRIANFWRVLREPELFPQLVRMATFTEPGRSVWEEAGEQIEDPDPVRAAWTFLVRCRLSRSGLMKSFSPITRNRTRRRMNALGSEWLGAIEGLADVHARLWPGVVVEDWPAVDLIRREDTLQTLFYCDPPYLEETRTSPGAYRMEMTEADHRQLLDVLKVCQGKVILSGYPSELYDTALVSWTRHSITLPNNAASGKTKRRMEEVLWMNYDPTEEAPLFRQG